MNRTLVAYALLALLALPTGFLIGLASGRLWSAPTLADTLPCQIQNSLDRDRGSRQNVPWR